MTHQKNQASSCEEISQMGRTQEHPGTAMLHAARMAGTPVCLQLASARSSGPRTTVLSRHHGHICGRQGSILPSSPTPTCPPFS